MNLDMNEVGAFVVEQFSQMRNGEGRTALGIYFTTIEKFNIPFDAENNFTRHSIRQIVLYHHHSAANMDMISMDTLKHIEHLKAQRKVGEK